MRMRATPGVLDAAARAARQMHAQITDETLAYIIRAAFREA